MKINRDNYELWFLDYLEGRLDADQEEMLRNFLGFNPDLEEEFEGLELIRLETGDENYSDKAALRRPVPDPDRTDVLDHFEEYCIYSIEQQLSPREEELLQEIIAGDTGKHKTYHLYRSTILRADGKLRFPWKSRLRKRTIDLPRVRIAVSSTAAAVLLGLSLAWFLTRPDTGEMVAGEAGSPEPGQAETTLPVENPESLQPTIEGDAAGVIQHRPSQAGGKPLEDVETVRVAGTKRSPLDPVTDEQISSRPVSFLAKLVPLEAEPLECQADAGNFFLAYSPEVQDEALHPVKGDNLQGNKSKNPGNRRLKKINLWKIADAGIERINEVSQEEYLLVRETDNSGRTLRFTFETPVFGISAPMRNTDMPR